jgi:hypothetical protein
MLSLRNVLRLDAAASGGLGVLLLVLFDPAEKELGLPVALSLAVGVLLLAWAAFVAWVSVATPRALVREVVALNIAYVALSVLVVVADWATLTDLGVAFVLVQALAVLGLTIGQLAGLRTGDDRAAVAA